MAHTMVYFIAGESYSNLAAIKNAGIVDVHLVIHGGGVTPPQQFVTDCNNQGLSPILNNGNDGQSGDGGNAQYYPQVAAMGYHAAGGESEQGDEIDRCMANLIFLDYGGEGTGGGTDDDVWNVTHPGPVSGHGAAGYYETYDASSNFWGWNVVGSGMTHAKAHGVKEIGIMVGSWMIGHSTAQDYIQLAQDMESNGITCAGIGVWSGYGNDINNLLNTFASWYSAWQAIWPPNMTTMKNRFTSPGPGPAPTPVKFASSPAICSRTDTTFDVFAVGADKALWHRYYDGKAWQTWESLGGILTSSPAVVTRGGVIYIFARGNDGALWQISWTGTVWTKWQSIGGKLLSGTSPTVCVGDATTLDVFVIGTDNGLWHRDWNGTMWGAWTLEAAKIE